MQGLKRKIPSFVFGLSIGLLIGIAFFLFKIDSIFNTLKSSLSSDKITVVEQKVESDEEKDKTKNKVMNPAVGSAADE